MKVMKYGVLFGVLLGFFIIITIYKQLVQRKVIKHDDFLIERPSEITSTSQHTQKGLTFGSLAILNSCWSEEELMGRPSDKKIIRPAPTSSRNIVDRLIPKNIRPPLDINLRNSIRSVRPVGNYKIVALTFDLCERENEITGYDADIVNYLRSYNIKATFFAGGKWMRSHPDKMMQLIADPLFEIGNHAWTHGNLRVLKGKEMEDQILWTQAQYELLWEKLESKTYVKNLGPFEMSKIPKIPLAFRFPYGACSSESLRTLAQYGLPAIQWDIVTGDSWGRQTPEGIAKIVLQKTKPGSIIVCHANGRGHHTAKALTIFIPKLRKVGYRFVTISELLTYGPVVATNDCFELKSGDTLRYDKRFGKGTE